MSEFAIESPKRSIFKRSVQSVPSALSPEWAILVGGYPLQVGPDADMSGRPRRSVTMSAAIELSPF